MTTPRTVVDKNNPDAEWIRALAAGLPTEPEIDRVLTRKLERRTSGSFTWPAFEELEAGLRSLLSAELGDRFRGVANTKWLPGGASKVQVYFDLTWIEDGQETQAPMVLRMDPAASIQETSRRREFELLQAFTGVVPVPAAYWLDDAAEHLPYPALVSGFVAGVTKPSAGSESVSGLKATIDPALREALGQQFIEHLATIHTHDVDDPALRSFTRAADAREVITQQINAWNRVWQEDSDFDAPIVRLALGWLRRNIPDVDRLSIVHSDYRTGNYLFTESDSQITAILDWEGGHVGDRHEDLAYTVSNMFGSDDGHGTFLVSGLMPEEQFLKRYEAVSGLPVIADSLRFWKIFNCVKNVIIASATAYRITSNHQTHQDVLVAWIIGTEGVLLEELRVTLEEVI
ncbi:phosphotransferase family protein [Gordonia sp. zg691]|nr:phosphotransferase family protein [Gordonia jinghuaiqii]